MLWCRSMAGIRRRLGSIGGFGKVYVGEAELGELVKNPLGRCGAFLRRELAGVGYRPDGDELAELVRACGIRPATRSRSSMSC